ncbi:MAG: DUF424 family protein [Candidatus Bathyarchaeia archaeon]
MDKVYLKVFKSKNCTLIAACDEELIGKTFKEGKLQIQVKRDFYGENPTSIDKALDMINGADIANLVGKTVIKAAIDKGYVSKDAVIYIAGIPHVQVVKI